MDYHQYLEPLAKLGRRADLRAAEEQNKEAHIGTGMKGIRANLRQVLEKQSERLQVFPRSTERERNKRWYCHPSP